MTAPIEGRSPSGSLRVAYLVNQYPSVSHTFIRREIEALESIGIPVERMSIRRTDPNALRDERDRAEAARTDSVLAGGVPRLVGLCAAELLRSPARWWRALRIALALGWRSDRGLLRHLAYLAEACVIRRELRDRCATHLHAHFATNAATVALLCRVLGGPPFSFTAHGDACFGSAATGGLGRKVEAARFAVAVSEDGRAQLMRWSDPTLWSKIHVVRCGLGSDLLEGLSTPPPDTPRLVCVARLVAVKGHFVLLDAADHLARSGVDFELVLVGDGPFREQLAARIEELGLQARVHMLGSLDGPGVRSAIEAARALVLASFNEGVPTVVAEAFALGRPVVSTAVGGVSELVEPDVSGWLVRAGSADALAQALHKALAAPPDMLAKMASAGRAVVVERYDARKEAAKLARLFLAARG
jgi:glycosyltransferase involved in cell wall biosynthesis